MENGIKNISSIVIKDLCVSCGACASVCPMSAIEYRFSKGLFLPIVSPDKCSNCGICKNVCPSCNIDVAKTYGKLDVSNCEEVECYSACAKNQTFRINGTSGGVVSTLTYELLKSGKYERAYVLNFENFNGSRANLLPVEKAEDVIACAKSKYIPASVDRIIDDIKNDSIGKAIIVGTPCQFLAVKRYLRLLRKEEDQLLFLGLFCDKTLNYNIYKYFEYKFGKFTAFHFRDKKANGWPGDIIIEQSGQTKVVDRKERMKVKSYFQLNRCRYCFDKLNQLADISFGDCYETGKETYDGLSSIIIRTNKGRFIFEETKQYLDYGSSSFDKIKNSQRLNEKLININRNRFDGPFCNFHKDTSFVILDEKNECIEKKKMQMGKCEEGERSIEKIIKDADAGKGASCFAIRALKRVGKLFYSSDDSYKVLIDKAGFNNRGAQLMLMSVIDRVRASIPNVQIVVPSSVYNENPTFCIKNTILPLHIGERRIVRMVKSFVYNNLFNEHSYVLPKHIDLVLDAGGFQFSDQFSKIYTDAYIEKRRRYYLSFTKKNRKIVFLPQAFGPFDVESSKKLMKFVYSCTDLIFAREPISYKYIKELFPADLKIKIAPDFTSLYHPKDCAILLPPKTYSVLIVNERMLTHTNAKDSNGYLDFMVQLAQKFIDKGENLILLNHEGLDDEKLLVKINVRLSKPLPIFTLLGANDVKNIIGGAKLVVSSRFHGVVCGLVQGVPTFCTSWSHKYGELLKEHKCENNALEIGDVEHAFDVITDAFINPEKYSTKSGCIDEINTRTALMWNDVFTCIGVK